MNKFNLNLCRQKCFLKDQIKESKRRDIIIDNFLKKYKKEISNDLKSSSVKMNYFLKEENNKSRNNNFFESILSKKNLNNKSIIEKESKNNNSKIEQNIWNFQSPQKKKISGFKTFFNMTIGSSNSRNNKSDRFKSSKITRKQYSERINEIFENYYRKSYLKKDYSKMDEMENHKLVSLQLIMGNNKKKHKKRKILRNEGNFIKEIIYMREPTSKEERMNTFDSNERIINFETVNTLPSTFKVKRYFSKYNSISESNNNLNNYQSDSRNKEKIIRIVNNKYIRDLFNMNNNNYNNDGLNNTRKNFFKEIQNKSKRFIKNRMVFYDTGRFDMPLAANLSN